MGISPDYIVHINPGVLSEVHGPLLRYGLQEMENRSLWLPERPKDRPDRERLSTRFTDFQRAG